MEKEQDIETLTALIASAFTHYREILFDPGARPPSPEQSRKAYLNDPVVNRFTDATVAGIYEILSHNNSVEPT